jgi:tetratricopeptide (TPR) repeat protein
MGEEKLETDPFVARSSFTKSTSKSGRASFFKSVSLALCLCTIFCAQPQSVFAAGDDKSAISTLENRLFFKTYDSEEAEARVARLEKQVFGDAASGDLHGRIQHLMDAVGAQQNPDGSVSGLSTPTPPPPQQPQQEQPQVSPEDNARAEREAAEQRSHVAAQAAKEERINNLLSQGVDLWRQKRGRDAIDKFQQVLRLDPMNAEANFSMGIAQESSNSLEDALASYQRAAQGHPDNKDYTDAVAAVQRKLQGKERIDDKGGALRGLAEEASAAYKRGEYISALGLYKELDEKAPNQALVKYNIGTLYLQTKNPIKALEYYKQALQLKPGEPRYKTAVDQLGKNLAEAQQQRQQIEQQWAQQESQNQGGQQRVGMPPQGMPPQGMPPQGYPPQGVTQVGMPPQGYQPQGVTQVGMPPQGYPQQQYNPAGAQPQKKGKKEKPPKQQAPQAPPQPKVGDIMSSFGIVAKSSHDGVEITEVNQMSRAAQARLLKGDIIKAVNGTVVTHTKQLNDILSKTQPGQPIQMTIQRAQQLGNVTL